MALLSALAHGTLAAADSLPRGVGPECKSLSSIADLAAAATATTTTPTTTRTHARIGLRNFRFQPPREAVQPGARNTNNLDAVAKFYTSKSTFTCISNPSIVLEASQLNDNSCDCPDGSDEPGTAACSYIDTLSPEQPLPGSTSGTTNTTNALPGFWCVNAGHIGSYIPFMYVNDGVCDYELCCDGSDEFSRVGGMQCENRCDAIGKEHRRLEEERRQSKERSAKRRRTMIKEARELRRRVEANVASLKSEIEALEVRKGELQKKYEEVERSERNRVVKVDGQGGKLGVLVSLAKTRVSELRNALDKLLDQRDDLQDRVEQLEDILTKFKEEYNPNFNDEGVKAAVKSWEDYAAGQASEKKSDLPDGDLIEMMKEDGETSGINWAEFEKDDASDADVGMCPQDKLNPSPPPDSHEWLS